MRFPRSAKILRSQFDVAPFAAVFFALLILLLLGGLMPVPGLRVSLQPPTADDLPGVDQPALAVAVDNQGRLYFRNQIVSEPVLKSNLVAAVSNAHEPLTLIIHADKSVSYEELAHLAQLARAPGIGITNLLLATLPDPLKLPVRP
jgi:biopolymer transport protein ExbD